MASFLRSLHAVLFTGIIAYVSAATLSAEVPAANGLLRREADTKPVESVVVGATGHGTLVKPQSTEEELIGTQKTTKLNTNDRFPFYADDLAFEFTVAPLRWSRCKDKQTVQLSTSDDKWQTCAARVQSEVGERSCSRRRGNMIWPKNGQYAIDNATKNYPCMCCADDPFENFGPAVNKKDAIWNVLWKKDCDVFTGTLACGMMSNDSHGLNSAECEKGGACDKADNRWTCCDKRCHEIAAGTKGSCVSKDGKVNTITDNTFVGIGWGPPYVASEALATYHRVDSQACGSQGRRPAMPKTAKERQQLNFAMKSWGGSLGFVWLGLTKDLLTEKWLWDDAGRSPLDPQPGAGGLLSEKSPWGSGEPTEHANQRVCADTRTGTWHGCSFSVSLRIACESWT